MAQNTLTRAKTGWYLLGPAFVAAIAYVDPGNVAANASSGAQFGYLLLWVIVTANLMAGLVQYLSAKLGLVTGRSLPEAVGERMNRPARLAYWVQAELVAMATDLAEVVGGAIALRILFGLPLLVGGLVTGVVSLLLLAIRDRRGQRLFEQLITGLLLLIAIGFTASFFVATPPPGAVLGGLVPRFDGTESVLLAAAILGATVMPHAVYLHSGLARDRHGHPDAGPPRRWLLRVTRWDVALAMMVAGGVNAAMLLVAALNMQGRGGTGSIEGAYAAVRDTVSPLIAVFFAIGLLVSGLASASVGAYAGAMIMQGLLYRSVPMLARRLVTLTPAMLILAWGFDPTRALVLSQVVLSFGIPFALFPLVLLTSNRAVMGADTNHRLTTAVGWAVALMISLLNVILVYLTVGGLTRVRRHAYFAYGSNLCVRQMSRRCPDATEPRPAMLGDHEWLINQRGVATVDAFTGGQVHGVLWQVSDDDLTRLDSAEGVPARYHRDQLTVHTDDGPSRAWIYIDHRVTPGAPRPGYLERIIDGAVHHRLPARWIEYLHRWDPARWPRPAVCNYIAPQSLSALLSDPGVIEVSRLRSRFGFLAITEVAWNR